MPTLRAAYVAMEVVALRAIVPLAWASLVTGTLISLGTKWGLFRHYWVLISLVLTLLATFVLVSETRVISHYAEVASDPSSSDQAVRDLGDTLPHSVGGLVVLLVVMSLNIYKPRGLTRYGWKRQQEEPPTGAEGADVFRFGTWATRERAPGCRSRPGIPAARLMQDAVQPSASSGAFRRG